MKLRGTGLLVPVALNYYYARVYAQITTVCVWMRRLARPRTSGVVSRDYGEALPLRNVFGIVRLRDLVNGEFVTKFWNGRLYLRV